MQNFPQDVVFDVTDTLFKLYETILTYYVASVDLYIVTYLVDRITQARCNNIRDKKFSFYWSGIILQIT